MIPEVVRMDFFWLLVAMTLLEIAHLSKCSARTKRIVMAGMGWIYVEIVAHVWMEDQVARLLIWAGR